MGPEINKVWLRFGINRNSAESTVIDWEIGAPFQDGIQFTRTKIIDAERKALKLFVNAAKLRADYEKVPRDRGGKSGPKGLAEKLWLDAEDAAMAAYEQSKGKTNDL